MKVDSDLDTHWVVMKVSPRVSQHGGMIEEITFANGKSQIAHTYVDADNSNYSRWRDIIDYHYRGCGIIVNGLRKKRNAVHKRTGEPLINADSPVVIRHMELDQQTVLDSLVESLQE
jgi:hypothetical protein